MAIPHTCPTCNGHKKRRAFGEGSTSEPMGRMVDCEPCFGTGIVWETGAINIPSVWAREPDTRTAQPWTTDSTSPDVCGNETYRYVGDGEWVLNP